MLKTRGAMLAGLTAATWLVVACSDSTAPTQSMTTVRAGAKQDALLGDVSSPQLELFDP